VRADELLELVGLPPARYRNRRPRQLSGGQAQRVGIARALSVAPDLIICDEAVSSLDVSIQAQILNLFEKLRRELRLTYIFIGHDLGVVKHVSDRVAVMYLGRIAEIGPSDQVYRAPAHPYTDSLLRSVAVPDVSVASAPPQALTGDLPSPVDPPSGCRFRTRCSRTQDRCSLQTPPLTQVSPGHQVACFFPLRGGAGDPVDEVVS
jgi:oligopeptide transport system ATP-binding protein